jgi:phosphatidylserine decarboxylase
MSGYLIAGSALAIATALPLAHKWQLGVWRAGLVVLAISMVTGIVVASSDPFLHFTTVTGTLAMWTGTIVACFAVLLAVFFADPERSAPSRQDVIISPADGRVIYVRAVQAGEIPVADKKGHANPLPELAGTALGAHGSLAIGISMNLSDVHVNRAPIAGRVMLAEHVPGQFGSLRRPDMAVRNERATTLIQAGAIQVAVVQIASRLVRRIVTFVPPGETVLLGQRIGAIRLGSQVDLLIPAANHVRPSVQVGDRVVAGRTIVALLTREPEVAAVEPPRAGRAEGQYSSPVSQGPYLPATSRSGHDPAQKRELAGNA